ncbi:MAG TPA: hypothetical protein VK279_12895 [Solirubrobacteraceae bacterium]|nr:hypothetical protein [Solirubrobacteraceae bacterium]
MGEKTDSKQETPPRPAPNITAAPRGNPDRVDHDDVERGVEKLEMVVGN